MDTNTTSSLSVDTETARELDHLAGRWGVSRQEALSRAVHEVCQESRSIDPKAQREAMRALREHMSLSKEEADRWIEENQRMREASSEARLRRLDDLR